MISSSTRPHERRSAVVYSSESLKKLIYGNGSGSGGDGGEGGKVCRAERGRKSVCCSVEGEKERKGSRCTYTSSSFKSFTESMYYSLGPVPMSSRCGQTSLFPDHCDMEAW